MPRPRRQMAGDGATDTPSFCAYYRVSTDGQGRSGLGLEAQKAAVAKFCAARGAIIAEYQEVESGAHDARPQLALALATCRARRATLIVAKLDRLTRNTSFLLSVADGAGDAGVVFCDLPELPPGPVGRFIVTMFAAVAELERGFISQRTKAALAAVVARGTWTSKAGNLCTRLGSHALARGLDAEMSRKGRAAQTSRANRHAADVLPFIDAAIKSGANSNREIAEALTARGVRPAMGGDRWGAGQVWRIRRARLQHT